MKYSYLKWQWMFYFLGRFFLSSITANTLNRNCLPFASALVHFRFLVGSVLLIFLIFYVVFLLLLCLPSSCVLCVPNVASVSVLSILDVKSLQHTDGPRWTLFEQNCWAELIKTASKLDKKKSIYLPNMQIFQRNKIT